MKENFSGRKQKILATIGGLGLLAASAIGSEQHASGDEGIIDENTQTIEMVDSPSELGNHTIEMVDGEEHKLFALNFTRGIYNKSLLERFKEGEYDLPENFAAEHIEEEKEFQEDIMATPTPTPTSEPTPTPEPTPIPPTPEPPRVQTPVTEQPSGHSSVKHITGYYCEYDGGFRGDGGGFCGHMANGEIVHTGAAACGPSYPFGTVMEIEGYGEVVCKDRGGAISDGNIDVFTPKSSGLDLIPQGPRNVIVK